MAVDQDVLQKVAEQRVDGPLVRALDFEVIRSRAVLTDGVPRLAEQESGGVAKRGAAGFDLFERPQPGLACGSLALCALQAPA